MYIQYIIRYSSILKASAGDLDFLKFEITFTAC